MCLYAIYKNTQQIKGSETLTNTTPGGVWILPVEDTKVDEGGSSLLLALSLVR